MNFYKDPACNDVMGAGDNPGVSDLPIERGQFETQPGRYVPSIVSYWMPTPEEMQAIAAGQPIMLHILGVRMPPVYVGVKA